MWSIKSPILAPKMSINPSFLGFFLFRDPGALIPGIRDAENHRDPGISGSREIPMKALILIIEMFIVLSFNRYFANSE